ncbi:MAG: radical SAM protein [Spirochaetales bacterium]
MITVKEIKTNDLITASKLPSADFVINPYVGCTNGCKYCYASFMKRFTNHSEPWGEFIDIKICDKPLNTKKLIGKSVFLASVTDVYNDFEKEYKLTQKILEQLVGLDIEISISTKNKLILRDINLLKQMKNLIVSFSINTTDEAFKNDMDKASSIEDRISALKTLHDNGIKTVCFVSPIFPMISDWQNIILKTKDFVDEYWFENLNLRGEYKIAILNYIRKKYPKLISLYNEIYIKNNKDYWQKLAVEINNFCRDNGVNFKNYFYHDKIKKSVAKD